MYRRLTGCICGAVAAVNPSAVMAAPHFVETQIEIHGNQNFDVSGINDSGTMVGTLYAAITGDPSGIILKKHYVTTIPAPYSGGGPAQPTSIYNDGTIIGSVNLNKANPGRGLTETFVLRNGVVDPNYEIALDYGRTSGRLGVNPIGLVGTQIFFTRVIDRSLPNIAEYGTPPNFQFVPSLALFSTIKGLSSSGVVSGTSFHETGPQKVFLGSGNNFEFIAPSGAISASGGVSNTAGEVAGSYIDTSKVSHGFVYNLGKYTTFDMPKAASQVVATAINDRGWVVGTYVSSANDKQHAFIYDGTNVTSIGTYDATVSLRVAVNNAGQAVISEQFFDPTPKFVSFLEVCHSGSC